jgi:Flp pilus assembly protein TadD
MLDLHGLIRPVGIIEPMARVFLPLSAGVLAIALAGCLPGEEPPVAAVDTPSPTANVDADKTSLSVQRPGDVKYYPSDEPLRLGQEYFNRGIYGVAQRYFQDAVEKAPKDPKAWIGLAASYDHLRRFDLADRAYHQAIELAGETTQILNNLGYSYMLRGKLTAAREKFNEAFQRDPDNPTIQNNINLLNGSSRFIERDP